jgi:hypothetical protein
MFRLFFTDGILKKESFNKKEITQIAPTISQKIKIAFPGTKANVLEEVLINNKMSFCFTPTLSGIKYKTAVLLI